MSKIQIFLKHYFPKLYRLVRQRFFPYVDSLRTKRNSKFSSPILKDINTLNTSFIIQLSPDNGFIDKHIYATGTYEPDILSVIKKYLKEGDVFVDIGGNIGWHTLFSATIVGKEGHVHTFEPIPKLQKQIQTSIEANKFHDRITLHTFGCSDKAETKNLHINHQNIGGSSMYDDKHRDTLKIELEPADTILMSLSKISLIKIDTEGYEVEVLRGLKETLKKKSPLLIEYSPSFWGTNKDERSQEFFSVLQAAGYKLYDLEDGYKEVSDISTWIKNFTKLQTNFLCLAE